MTKGAPRPIPTPKPRPGSVKSAKELLETQREEVDRIRNWLSGTSDEEIDSEAVDNFFYLFELADSLLKYVRKIERFREASGFNK